ncbi:uncharacterized protein TRIADDRAFT_30839 [Trichoplax adhaerens]|uniref:Kinesin-like protein n=1 Tax=Trichoplax adhaerens TaxID=10228 RepID=B3S877_TRIAD|nr:hypothetical protein TRIADDRAFT_30839 [Trichoplax adhaerens]EDV21150.1 hypothetical protein TRIADDRAFT_30839 [Trichoplax adhaerens]|eukprot:XP_002116480.1 hypothetical protein TRIADDRAFT_30839 [Trichoplax adhaerens]
MSKNSRVKVVVRSKPTANFAHEFMKIEPDHKTIVLHDEKATDNSFINNKVHDWTFNVDKVLHNASQEAVYDECGKDTVSKALNGYNSTIFAYGQTGAGKTFTITGTTENYKNRGIIPRAIAQIFQHVKEHTDTAYNISASYLEIYNETMFDLLSTLPEQKLYQHEQLQPMSVVEDPNGSTSVKGLRVQCITSEEEALNLLFEGETNRVIASHALNKSSSRSHCIFTVYIESRSRVDSMAKVISSKLHFVDLAGSERLGKTGSRGDTQKEAVYINKSLTFLEQVIIALADKKREHIPYRQSKLTHVLKDSIGGKCNTLMIANIWGESSQIEETSSTLRFAARVMCVPSEPALNIHYDAAQLILQYEKEIKALKLELAMHSTLANRGKISYDPISELRLQEIRREVRAFLSGQLETIEIESVRQVKAVFQEFKNQMR